MNTANSCAHDVSVLLLLLTVGKAGSKSFFVKVTVSYAVPSKVQLLSLCFSAYNFFDTKEEHGCL